jgi:hypothetical protein
VPREEKFPNCIETLHPGDNKEKLKGQLHIRSWYVVDRKHEGTCHATLYLGSAPGQTYIYRMVDRVRESTRRRSGGYIDHETCIRSRTHGTGIKDYEVPIEDWIWQWEQFFGKEQI